MSHPDTQRTAQRHAAANCLSTSPLSELHTSLCARSRVVHFESHRLPKPVSQADMCSALVLRHRLQRPHSPRGACRQTSPSQCLLPQLHAIRPATYDHYLPGLGSATDTPFRLLKTRCQGGTNIATILRCSPGHQVLHAKKSLHRVAPQLAHALLGRSHSASHGIGFGSPFPNQHRCSGSSPRRGGLGSRQIQASGHATQCEPKNVHC
mmetsp:Transcript_73198/g.145189  ORF Transcript_73198/g.145189 Transcript_73198/m.145189 type:complete len:208 (-) Transcript_73198:495-1118(-)